MTALPKTFSLPVLAVLLLVVPPDEGQWLPSQIRKMDWAKLRKRGMELTKDEFWHPEKGGVLTASVQINGCSASFVSTKGLLVTNHHCGFGAIQQVSTMERNYLRDGFVAKTEAEELPARGMRVRIVRRIEDVTEKIHAAIAKAKTPLERFTAEQIAIRRLVSEGEAKNKDTECSITSMFEGREYHLYYRTLLTDVRLVYAPPRSIGEFGGEVDNWEWPRHTGDFTFFRAYAAPDGTPRGYDEDNVPFKPKHILKVSKAGVHEKDLVLILGYPGRTERYLSSVAVKDRQGVYYPLRLDLLTNIIHNIEAVTKGDEEKALAYSSTLKSIANVQKNALGMVKGLARNAVVERKLREEDQFRKWLALDDARKEQYGHVLDNLMELDREAAKTSAKDLVLITMFNYPGGRVMPFFASAFGLVQGAATQDPEQDISRRLKQLALGGSKRDFDAVQLTSFAMLVEAGLELPKNQRIRGIGSLADNDDTSEKTVAEKINDMAKNSPLWTRRGRLALLQNAPASVRQSKDPFVKMLLALADEWRALVLRRRTEAGRRLVVGPKWIDAQQAWRGTSFYPDANRTMRVSIASVKGYQPHDGIWHVPHTTVAGVLEKYTGKDPFDCPKKLLEAAKSRKTSRFFDQGIGDVPVCFLSDGDTTGGNSGSPVINGKGELVGLNFDRVFEAVSGDYGWNPDRSRNISVDIRYVLWILEQVQPAPHLLKEMGL